MHINEINRLTDLRKKELKGKSTPIHIVAQAAEIDIAASDITLQAFTIKYGDSDKKGFIEATINTIAKAQLLLERL